MKRSRLTVEQRQELARRHASGENVNALAKAYQVIIRQVYRVIADEKGDTRGRARVTKSVSFRAPTGEIEAFLTS